MSAEDKHPLQDIASQMAYAGKSLSHAIDNEDMNERSSLELAMMTLGALAEEAGLGDDVKRWLSHGVDNQRNRRSVERVPVTTWCGNCRGHGCDDCDQKGKVTR